MSHVYKTILKTDKKTDKRYNYYRLCSSYRIGIKVKHGPIVSMGKLDGIETKEERKLLDDLIEIIVQGGSTPLFSFDVKPMITEYAKEFSTRLIN